MAVLSVAGDSLRSVTVRGGHEMFSVHRVPPAFASGPRGEGGQRAGCVDVRAGRGAAEDTSSDAAVHGYF